jgi:ABC-type cobalamin/Fe3+-siderophores transport system ATPase subunit
MKCIDHIYPAQGGAVLVDGRNISSMTKNVMAQNIAYVPQQSASAGMTVFDAVLLGRKPYIKWDATSEDREIVCDILSRRKLDGFALRSVSTLSGGEAQKVLLARALAQEPKLLLLDEPTSSLDPRNQHEVLQSVRKIARDHHICVALIIHDLNLAIRYCDRFIFPQGFARFRLRRTGDDDGREHRAGLRDTRAYHRAYGNPRNRSVPGRETIQDDSGNAAGRSGVPDAITGAVSLPRAAGDSRAQRR